MSKYGSNYAKRRQAARGTKGGKYFRFTSAGSGEFTLRIIPFTHTVSKFDAKIQRYDPDEFEIGDEVQELWITHRRHFTPTAVNCGRYENYDGVMMGHCEHCDTADELEAGSESERKEARNYRPAIFYQAIGVVLEKDRKPYQDRPTIQHIQMPGSLVDFLCEKMDSKKYRNKEIFGEDGLDVLVTYDKDAASPRDKYKYDIMDKEDSVEFRLKDCSGNVEDLCSDPNYFPVGVGSDNSDVSDSPRRRPKKTVAVEEDVEEETEEVLDADSPDPEEVAAVEDDLPFEPDEDAQEALAYSEGQAVSWETADGRKVGEIIEIDEEEGRARVIAKGGRRSSWYHFDRLSPSVSEGELVVEEEPVSPNTIAKGRRVKLEFDGEVLEGEVISNEPDHDGFWEVRVGNEEYGCTEEELTVIQENE